MEPKWPGPSAQDSLSAPPKALSHVHTSLFISKLALTSVPPFFFKFTYLFWGGEQSMSRGGAEREKERENPKQDLCVSTEPDVRLELTNLEITI